MPPGSGGRGLGPSRPAAASSRRISNHTWVDPSWTPQRSDSVCTRCRPQPPTSVIGRSRATGTNPTPSVDDLDAEVLGAVDVDEQGHGPVAAVLHGVRDELGDEQPDVGEDARLDVVVEALDGSAGCGAPGAPRSRLMSTLREAAIGREGKAWDGGCSHLG